MSDVAQLLLAIDADCAALDAAGKELGKLIVDLGTAELAYGDRFDEELALLVEEHDRDEKRLPGEDVRRALIHKRIDPELHREVRRLERRKEAVEAWGRKIEKALSGRQSELSFLRAEGMAPGTEQPQWSQSRRAA